MKEPFKQHSILIAIGRVVSVLLT